MEGEKQKSKEELDQLVVPTEKGLVKQDLVNVQKAIHMQQVKDNSGLLTDPDELQPRVNLISTNQTQEYFAIATSKGFEILQNDTANKRLKKKVQDLENEVAIVEMMYKTNVIVLVYAN